MAQAPRATAPTESDPRRRAPALSPTDRRQMIVDSVVPLLAAHGADLTSRQIAEAAGVAEGTIFRAFGDKETLLRAAAEQYFDESVVLDELRAIDPDSDLEQKLGRVLALMHERFRGALRVMSVLGDSRPTSNQDLDDEASTIVDDLFAPDAQDLAWTPSQIMHAVRLLAFASSVPEIAATDDPFSTEDLAMLLSRGVRRTGSGDPLAPGHGS